jgi:hypothetical protein
MERDDHLGHIGIGLVLQLVELALGLLAPMPGVLEGGDLRVALVPLGCLEEHGIIPLRIKRWIEIDEVNTLRGDVVSEDVEIVAEVEFVQGYEP